MTYAHAVLVLQSVATSEGRFAFEALPGPLRAPSRRGRSWLSSPKSALMKPLRSRAVERNTLSSPLRIFAAADGGAATLGREGWNGVLRSCRLAGLFHPGDSGLDYAGMLAAAPASEAMNLPAGCVGPGANSSHRN